MSKKPAMRIENALDSSFWDSMRVTIGPSASLYVGGPIAIELGTDEPSAFEEWVPKGQTGVFNRHIPLCAEVCLLDAEGEIVEQEIFEGKVRKTINASCNLFWLTGEAENGDTRRDKSPQFRVWIDSEQKLLKKPCKLCVRFKTDGDKNQSYQYVFDLSSSDPVKPC